MYINVAARKTTDVTYMARARHQVATKNVLYLDPLEKIFLAEIEGVHVRVQVGLRRLCSGGVLQAEREGLGLIGSSVVASAQQRKNKMQTKRGRTWYTID